MWMARHGHPPPWKIRVNKLAMATALSRQSPPLAVQSINDVSNLHRAELDQAGSEGQFTERRGERLPPTGRVERTRHSRTAARR